MVVSIERKLKAEIKGEAFGGKGNNRDRVLMEVETNNKTNGPTFIITWGNNGIRDKGKEGSLDHNHRPNLHAC